MEDIDYLRFGGLRAAYESSSDVPPLHTLADGVYRVGDVGGFVHFLIQGSKSGELPMHEAITVMFHGDLSTRSAMIAPFFAGRGVQTAVNKGPIICFSDPIVEMDSECTLAWFAGSAALDVPNIIAAVIDSLTLTDPRSVWLVGGSGGGFAALNIGHRTRRPVSVAVWNPQSAVARYIPERVLPYLRSAFPDLQTTNGERALEDTCKYISRAARRDFALEQIIEHGRAPERILVLQNYNDWHIIPHTAPLIDALGLQQRHPGFFADASGTRVAWFTELGHGHAPPETDRLVKLLTALYSSPDHNLEKVISYLDSAELFPAARWRFRPLDLRLDGREVVRLLKLTLEENLAVVDSDFVVEEQHRLTYRFSLLRQGAVFSQSAWHSRMDWPMFGDNSPRAGDVVAVDIRDGFGHALTRLQASAPR